MPGYISPALQGYLTGQQQDNQNAQLGLQMLTAISRQNALNQQMEQNKQLFPLQLQHLKAQTDALPAQALLRNAQTIKAINDLQAAQDQSAARTKLAALLQPPATPGADNQTFMNEQQAKDAAIAADQAGTPFNYSVPNPANIRSLAIQASPKEGIDSLLKTITPNPAAASPLAKVMAERDALPPGDPRMAAYNDAIKKQTTINQPNPPQPHFVTGVDDAGNQTVHVFDNQGNLIKSTATGSQAPSWQNNANIRERQLATQLNTTIKPHLNALDAYQRYEQIRATGDSSQANQFLAQQVSRMSQPGSQRYLSKNDLERILGTTFEGGNWAQRAANYVSQIATGTRTPELDQKLNSLADAMALASAKRVGQEIQNIRASAPDGVNPDRIVGSKPRVYGRFIITPTGTVFAFKNADEANAKLSAAAAGAQ